MPLRSRLVSLWRNLVHKDRLEHELAEEAHAYLELLIESKIKEGADPAGARRAALIEMGGVEQVKESVREVRIGFQLETFWQDVRYAVRSLRKQALLSIAVVATLTLGIGVSTGVFTKYNAEYLRTHVDKDLDSFVRVYTAYTKDSTDPGRLGEMTLEDYLAFRDRAKSLRNLAAYADIRGVRLGKDDPKDVRTLLVTFNFFSVYDLEQPLMGRLLQPEDYVAANPVVVLSERLWRNRFAADPQIVGKVTHFNGQPVTVVGVTPNFMGMINGASAWFPYTIETYLKHGDDLLRPGEAAWLNVVGRLNPGFSRRDAAAELRLLASQQDRLHAGRTTTLTITDGSWFQDPEHRGNNRMVFAALLGALLIFVLIACLNVTTLLLARAAARQQEIAVRLALGAGKMRLVRMLVTETFLLASVAGLASLYLTHQIPRILDKLLTSNSEGASADFSQAPDWRVFAYLALVTVLAAVMAGLAPAFQSLKVNFAEMLKGRQSNFGGDRGPRLYGLLIGAQVALSFCLLYLAGLFVSVAQKAASFEPGFETRQVISTGLFIQSKDVGSEPRNWGPLHHTLAERLRTMPGVQSVAHSKHFQFINVWATRAQGQAMRQAATSWVSSNYFTTLGIPIVSGHALREDDHACGRAVCSAVVSQQLAREFWPGENPLGQTLRDTQGNSFEVVGVARDISSMRLGLPDDPMIYQPLNLNGTYPPHPLVRFSGDGTALTRAITAAARDLAPELDIHVGTIQAWREGEIESLWRQTRLIVLLCAMAVILAVIGIYGVVAFAVSQRTKEVGIRIALGAQKKDIYRAVLGASGRPVAIGLLIGLVLTVSLFSTLAPLLGGAQFSVNVRDPISYAMTAILLGGVALAAMLVPARRATRVDPMIALREE
jgi:putative ABC transport system permease protein